MVASNIIIFFVFSFLLYFNPLFLQYKRNLAHNPFCREMIFQTISQKQPEQSSSSLKLKFIEYNVYQMNNPKCPKGKVATMVCVTETCHRYAFMCSQCDSLSCQKGHQFCKTMLWSSALERIYNYPKY